MSHLSHAEREAYTAAFLKLDLDGNGALDKDEFAVMCRALGFTFSPSTLDRLFNQMDSDGNGKITLDEFLSAMSHKSVEETREEANLRRSFNKIDKDGDGYLTAEEFRQALKLAGRTITLEHALKMVDKIDTDGDGRVSLEEYIAYGKSKKK
ncbi:calmodulin-like [Gigantopelta aegis]|uniref:calmodulin-like n=1 Tax=Gigantopelta aegis TaxID=1735272 RepID=UPI001B8899B7|nr:calmodulin-like [Gigantopelta aegis]